VIRDEDRPTVRAISLQKWAGQFWSGTWEHQQYLSVPTARSGKSAPGEAVEASESEEETEAAVEEAPVEEIVSAEADVEVEEA
jgi:hypothetical protein